MGAAEKEKGIKKRKVKLMALAVLAACSAVAMPTNGEIEKANAEVMMAFRKHLAAWQHIRHARGSYGIIHMP